MKRVFAVLFTVTLVVGWGCGKVQYEHRLEYTLDEMRYRQRLDQFLIPAPAEAKYKDFLLYIRPPIDMKPSSQFLMLNEADLPPGQFDLAASFGGETKGNLHVLARRKAAKKAQAKGAAPPAQAADPPRPFDQEVLAILGRVYPADALQTPKFENEKKKSNDYRRLIFRSQSGNAVRVYLYKREPYDVALIWDTPDTQDKNATLASARDLCLQSFAVGPRAKRYFAGSMSESDGGEGGPSPGGGGETAQPF